MYGAEAGGAGALRGVQPNFRLVEIRHDEPAVGIKPHPRLDREHALRLLQRQRVLTRDDVRKVLSYRNWGEVIS